jgi:cytochrome oxidase Cu insertion factor (SCO1/SenC/PrrC family)
VSIIVCFFIHRKWIKSSLVVIVVTACSAPAAKPDAMMNKDAPTADAMMAKATPTADAMMKKDAPTADAMMAKITPTADTMMAKAIPTADAMMGQDAMAAPAWFNAKLTDVNTGKSFKLADLKGKVVLVETMAVWCSNCLKQQNEVKALHAQLGKRDDFVSVALDIDPNENDGTLKAHAMNRGFDWTYAVTSAEVAREIGQLYGAQFLNPPSTPMLIIDRQGKAHPLPFGIKSGNDLKAALAPYLKQS